MHTNLRICRPQATVVANHEVGRATHRPRTTTPGPLKFHN